MRIPACSATTLTLFIAACASAPKAGSLGEGSAPPATIVAVDTATPPKSASVQLHEAAYAALLLVAPGHSATLLYPADSLANNHLSAGATTLSFKVPETLVPSDSAVLLRRSGISRDSSVRTGRGGMARTGPGPILAETPTYLLLVTSPQRLDYARIREKTAGVSLPVIDAEALNATGKTIKSTLAVEPRTWAGYFHRVALSRKP